MASTDSRPVPIKNTAFRAVFPIYDADGDLVTGAASLDSEVSKDQGTFADCTNEATEIATASGMYYLDLTSTEMNADCVAVIVKTGTAGAKTTVLVFYPEETGDINVDVTAMAAGVVTAGVIATDAIDNDALAANAITEIAAGIPTAAGIADAVWDEAASGHVTAGTFGQKLQVARANVLQSATSSTAVLDTGASASDDAYNGLIILIVGGLGEGQFKHIDDYTGSSKTATINGTWTTTPDSTSRFVLIGV